MRSSLPSALVVVSHNGVDGDGDDADDDFDNDSQCYFLDNGLDKQNCE